VHVCAGSMYKEQVWWPKIPARQQDTAHSVLHCLDTVLEFGILAKHLVHNRARMEGKWQYMIMVIILIEIDRQT